MALGVLYLRPISYSLAVSVHASTMMIPGESLVADQSPPVDNLISNHHDLSYRHKPLDKRRLESNTSLIIWFHLSRTT